MTRRSLHTSGVGQTAGHDGYRDGGAGGLVDRRRFLQAALGGGAAAAGIGGLALPSSARATPTGVATTQALADAFQGTVVGIQGNEITVNTALDTEPEYLRVTTITSKTLLDSITNGLPALGDNLLVRTVIPGQAEKAWVNRVSFDAQITQQASNALQVSGAHPWGGAPITIDVPTNADTEWYGPSGLGPIPSEPLATAYIIGYRISDSAVAATTVSYMTEADLAAAEMSPPPLLEATQVQVQTGPDAVTCYKQWSGSASTFCCPGCGNPYCSIGCSNNATDQAAWPRTYGVQNCDNGCTSQCALKCSDSFQSGIVTWTGIGFRR